MWVPGAVEAFMLFVVYFPVMGQAVAVPAANSLLRVCSLMTVSTAQCPVAGGCLSEIPDNIVVAGQSVIA
jgi:hypothetical protein